MIEELEASGHKPFEMTLHRFFHTFKCVQKRKAEEAITASLSARSAQYDKNGFEEHVNSLLGKKKKDPEDLKYWDFDEEEDEE